MITKSEERKKAIKLRKKGHTYSEILREIPVAKSTLSLWLGQVGLSKKQKQNITKKKLDAAKRGAMAMKQLRIERVAKIRKETKKDIESISKRDLWLMGIMLYWAEGAKEKEGIRHGIGIDFGNSDPKMINLFLIWLNKIADVSYDDIYFTIYIHENSKNRLSFVRKYWAEHTKLPINKFQSVYFKKHNIKTVRKNIGDNYFGLLRVRVSKSSDLNRRIMGWVTRIDELTK